MADAQPTETEAPAPPARPFRRRGVGPFSLRQVTIAILAVMGTAIVLTLATVPLGSTEPGRPVPHPSAFLIGSAVPGPGIRAAPPGREGTSPDRPVQPAARNGPPLRPADPRGQAGGADPWAPP